MKWKLVSIFILCCVLEKSVILSVCSLWIIKLHFDIALLRTKDICEELIKKSSLENLKISEKNILLFLFICIIKFNINHFLESLEPLPVTQWWVHGQPFLEGNLKVPLVNFKIHSKPWELKSNMGNLEASGMEWPSWGSRWWAPFFRGVGLCGCEWRSCVWAEGWKPQQRTRVLRKRGIWENPWCYVSRAPRL